MSLFLFTTAISSAIAEACTPALADPHLIWPFVGTAVAGFVLAAFFWFMYRDVDNDAFIIQAQDNNSVGAGNHDTSVMERSESASDDEKRAIENRV